MTREDDFQAQLDANPADWQTRLVFADWLQDRDDPRAEGYRALGLLARWPAYWAGAVESWRWGWLHSKQEATYGTSQNKASFLPDDWYHLIPPAIYQATGQPLEVAEQKGSRREAEDAAARAFARLPANRRDEILAGAGPQA